MKPAARIVIFLVSDLHPADPNMISINRDLSRRPSALLTLSILEEKHEKKISPHHARPGLRPLLDLLSCIVKGTEFLQKSKRVDRLTIHPTI